MLRRDSLKFISSATLVLFSGLLKPVSALAKWNQVAFDDTDYDTAINSYFPDQQMQVSNKIAIKVHPIIENGAVVPVEIKTDLAEPESITIFVDKNPTPLIANFDLFAGSIGFVSTRIKMEQPSNIIVVVKSEGKFYTTKTFVEVQEGGCG
ncbi:MAG TPA: thiosulfate oxidation carrier protein SoxY [Thiotrichaceae bacterium]|jgi:sulfur-oxidizing protein SoxY|nr:thiosulfate oxidation carrier protein SoxY [Thiotrichaceae bacterium]HIM07555.1 thiosulfate oxidation carrier protein SoxY [Gammaproteobacteria bacterium]